MRALLVTAAWLALAAGALRAQSRQLPADSAQRVRDALSRDPFGTSLPVTTPISLGERIVAPGEVVNGPAVTMRGDLIVSGSVLGDAVAIEGNVIVREGGIVSGDAVANEGRVRLEGGTVRGETRTITGRLGITPATVPARSAAATMWSQILLALGWLATLAALGVIVLLFARSNLEGVAEAVQRSFGRSFLFGLATQLALLPAFIVMIVVLLVIPIIGWALLPFAIIAFLIAVAGALALGFLSMSQVTGEAISRRGRSMGGVERVLFLGLAAYMSLWILAALLGSVPVLGAIAGIVAFVVTWVATTVGFGATVVSRGGTAESVTPDEPLELEDNVLEWQTPTPVTGVAAARRPTPAPRRGMSE